MADTRLARRLPEDAQRTGNRKRCASVEKDPKRIAERVLLFRPNLDGIAPMLAKAKSRMWAEPEAIRAVGAFHPDSLWMVARRASFDPLRPHGEGFAGFLFLNPEGLAALAARTFDERTPSLRLLSPPGERPAGIYLWAVDMPDTLTPALTLIFDLFSQPPYEGVTRYRRGAFGDNGLFTGAAAARQS